MSLDQLLEWIPAGGPEEALARQVEFDRLPRHVAIIMDGNGRWAGERHLPRVEGHRAGVDAVRDVVETSARLGLEVLTLYAFSVENWKRPAAEVSTLMMLLKRYLGLELDTLLRNNIRFNVIGRVEALAPDVRTELLDAERKTAKNTGMLFNIALNYGGRTEIVDAARRAIESGIKPAGPRRGSLRAASSTPRGQPDPDLLIRTSGEMRVSNFLLWQIAYAEIWVTDTLWPDFRCRTCSKACSRTRSAIADSAASPRRCPPASGEPAVRAPSPKSQAHMTRVLSGVVLGAAALALIWFLSSIALLGVALVVAAMAFHEYDRIVDAIGAKVPYWTALLATLLACAMVPFQWVDIESVLAAALLLIALNVLASDRVGTPLLADTAAAVLAPVYIGLPLGCLVGVHAIAGREAVLLLIATVAVSDTAQYYTGRTLGRTPLAPLRSPKKTREGAIGGFVDRADLPRARRLVLAAGLSVVTGTPASASASSSPASSATCSSRC